MLECPACGFQNIDVQSRCVRCGAWLRPDVVPTQSAMPRAKGRRRVRKTWYRWRRASGFHWRPEKRRAESRRAGEESSPETQAWREAMETFGLAIGAFLPGLVQFRMGRRIRGWIFLGMLTVGMIALLLAFGSRWWQWALAIIVVAQVNSLCDVLNFSQYTLGRRVLYSTILSFCMFWALFLVYSHFYRNVEAAQGGVRVMPHYLNGPLLAGDLVRVRTQSAYQLGDIVQIDATKVISTLLDQYNNNRNVHYYLPDDIIWIDRIVAVPGQQVRIADNKIYLNGSREPSTVVPLNPAWKIADSEWKLKEDEYLVLPSWFNFFAEFKLPALDVSYISGRVERIFLPIWRRGIL